MAIQTVFSDNLDPGNGSLSARFINATGFYIDAPLISEELEIDVFLQVYLPANSGERIRNLPLGKLVEGQIKLNQTDTETIAAIPYEYVGSGLEMALFFLASSTTYIEAYAVGSDCTLCQIREEILALSQEVNARFDGVDGRLSNIENVLSQILATVNTPDPPIIVPAASEQAFFFIQ